VSRIASGSVARGQVGPYISVVNSTISQLEWHMRALPDEELQKIIGAGAEEYTAEARLVARTVLSLRTAAGHSHEEPADRYLDQPPPLLRRISLRIERWKRSVLPARIPGHIGELFWWSMACALPAYVTVTEAVVRIPRDSAAINLLTSAGGLSLLAIGLLALILAYGIYTERRYPRFLAVGFVLAALCVSFRRPRRSEDEPSVALEPVGAIGWSYRTIKYMLRSSEASAYYAQLKMR